MATNGVRIFVLVWFAGLAVIAYGHRRDVRGSLTRVVEQSARAAQHTAFDLSQSESTRRAAGTFDVSRARRQQRRAAGIACIICATVAAYVGASLMR